MKFLALIAKMAAVVTVLAPALSHIHQLNIIVVPDNPVFFDYVWFGLKWLVIGGGGAGIISLLLFKLINFIVGLVIPDQDHAAGQSRRKG